MYYATTFNGFDLLISFSFLLLFFLLNEVFCVLKLTQKLSKINKKKFLLIMWSISRWIRCCLWNLRNGILHIFLILLLVNFSEFFVAIENLKNSIFQAHLGLVSNFSLILHQWWPNCVPRRTSVPKWELRCAFKILKATKKVVFPKILQNIRFF